MSRPISVLVHIKALQHNLKRMREAAQGRTLWAVVKANAYGHVLENAVKGFAEADGLALIEIREAQRARAAGWTKRILMIEGFFDASDVEHLETYGVEPVVHSRWQIELLKAVPHTDLKVHVKINSGMNRLGFLPQQAREVIDEINAIKGVQVVDIVTHFANAEQSFEGEGPATVARQLSRMQPLLDSYQACMANSAATLLHPQVGGSGVRGGIVLYGISPDPAITSEELGLKPAMTLTAKIIAVREVAPGEAVGYGSRWVAQRPTRIAVVACGYADGAQSISALGKNCAEGTQEAVDAAWAGLKDGSLHIFDTSKFTVGGETVTTSTFDLSIVDFVTGNVIYEGDTVECIKDGYFEESVHRAAPYFSLRIDGITELNAQ